MEYLFSTDTLERLTSNILSICLSIMKGSERIYEVLYNIDDVHLCTLY